MVLCVHTLSRSEHTFAYMSGLLESWLTGPGWTRQNTWECTLPARATFLFVSVSSMSYQIKLTQHYLLTAITHAGRVTGLPECCQPAG